MDNFSNRAHNQPTPTLGRLLQKNRFNLSSASDYNPSGRGIKRNRLDDDDPIDATLTFKAPIGHIAPSRENYLIKNIDDLPVFITVENYRIASYSISGEPFLCLPQLLRYLKQNFTTSKIVEKFEESFIHFAEADPKQIEGFIKACVLPPKISFCLLIKRSDADRICLQLFEQCLKEMGNSGTINSLYKPPIVDEYAACNRQITKVIENVCIDQEQPLSLSKKTDEIYKKIQDEKSCHTAIDCSTSRNSNLAISSKVIGSSMIQNRMFNELRAPEIKNLEQDSTISATSSTLKIRVYHRCFGKCAGIYYPTLLNRFENACIECLTCHIMFSPRRFIGHTHGPNNENNVCHWGFNSYFWNYYLRLSKKQNMNKLSEDELVKQFKMLVSSQEDRDMVDRSKDNFDSTHNSSQCENLDKPTQSGELNEVKVIQKYDLRGSPNEFDCLNSALVHQQGFVSSVIENAQTNLLSFSCQFKALDGLQTNYGLNNASNFSKIRYDQYDFKHTTNNDTLNRYLLLRQQFLREFSNSRYGTGYGKNKDVSLSPRVHTNQLSKLGDMNVAETKDFSTLPTNQYKYSDHDQFKVPMISNHQLGDNPDPPFFLTIEGYRVASISISGEPYLCLPQLLFYLKPKFTIKRMIDKFEECMIQFIDASEGHVKDFIKLNILPPTAKSCPLIKRSDADRVCLRLFEECFKGRKNNLVDVCSNSLVSPAELLYKSDQRYIIDSCRQHNESTALKQENSSFDAPTANQFEILNYKVGIKNRYLFESEAKTPLLSLAKAMTSTLIIRIYHRCFGKCIGLFYPLLLNNPKAICIECTTCHTMLTPRRFVGHTHGPREDNVCHWGFNSYNWRYYIQLSRKQTMHSLDDEELLNQFKLLRQSSACMDHPKHEVEDNSDYEFDTPDPNEVYKLSSSSTC